MHSQKQVRRLSNRRLSVETLQDRCMMATDLGLVITTIPPTKELLQKVPAEASSKSIPSLKTDVKVPSTALTKDVAMNTGKAAPTVSAPKTNLPGMILPGVDLSKPGLPGQGSNIGGFTIPSTGMGNLPNTSTIGMMGKTETKMPSVSAPGSSNLPGISKLPGGGLPGAGLGGFGEGGFNGVGGFDGGQYGLPGSKDYTPGPGGITMPGFNVPGQGIEMPGADRMDKDWGCVGTSIGVGTVIGGYFGAVIGGAAGAGIFTAPAPGVGTAAGAVAGLQAGAAAGGAFGGMVGLLVGGIVCEQKTPATVAENQTASTQSTKEIWVLPVVEITGDPKTPDSSTQNGNAADKATQSTGVITTKEFVIISDDVDPQHPGSQSDRPADDGGVSGPRSHVYRPADDGGVSGPRSHVYRPGDDGGVSGPRSHVYRPGDDGGIGTPRSINAIVISSQGHVVATDTIFRDWN